MLKNVLLFVLLFFCLPVFAQNKTPNEIYGPLFYDVQKSEVFTDSKTFVDCVPKRSADSIVADYITIRKNPAIRFSLRKFLAANFFIPQNERIENIHKDVSIFEHINQLWDSLKRSPDTKNNGSSLIPLPYPYIVPGGRFREIYYWDSYFTMLGLEQAGKKEMIKSMLDNFTYLINKFGHIPNGNRSYYISRSQPPFFCLMVDLYLKADSSKENISKYYNAVEKEYHYWMDTANRFGSAVLINKILMNRYSDELSIPRQESYREDVNALQKANHLQTPEHPFYKHIRAAACSGWDFSSRWFADTFNIQSIRTLNIIPVDLNSLLFYYEMQLASYYKKFDSVKHKSYLMAASQRKDFLFKYCFNEEDGLFYDYDFVKKEQVKIKSLATMYPLFLKMATKSQSLKISKNIETHFLKPGGVVTTLFKTGQQWDAPNGWAPLQWITVCGLRNYEHYPLADTISNRWLQLNMAVYNRTGKMMEKYNVENIKLIAGGGEYPSQDGFGWTNGVFLALWNLYNINQ